MADKKSDLAVFSSREMLKEHAAKGTKISYTDRKAVEVIKATKHYTVGMMLNPHVIKADALIKQGIAKAVK